MSSAPLLSASVTRILSLTGFAPELKTKDFQQAFSEYENQNGGFKIKWVDDTSLLLVFNDAGVAKRAYLQTLLTPPELLAPKNGPTANIKPYNGADAQAVIYTVSNRRNTRGQSISQPNGAHARSMSHSNSANGNPSGSAGRNAWKTAVVANGLAASMHAPENITIPNLRGGDGGSPTLPNLASQPTLNSLINSSLSTDVINSSNEGTSASEPGSALASDPLSSPDEQSPTSLPSAISPVDIPPAATPPRVGDSAKRMVGAALGLKHPGVASRRSLDPNETLQKAMGGLVIAE